MFITEKGVVLVERKIAGWGPRSWTRFGRSPRRPVITIINTYQHFDHVGGNSAFPQSVEIIAHENAKTNMEKMVAVFAVRH